MLSGVEEELLMEANDGTATPRGFHVTTANDLSDDVWTQCLSYLTGTELCTSISVCCKRLYELANQPCLWEALHEKVFEEPGDKGSYVHLAQTAFFRNLCHFMNSREGYVL